MPDHLFLTGAELWFLLSAQAEAAAGTADLLGLTEAHRTPAVAEAGFGSLALRDLITVDGDQYRLAPAVAAVGEGLSAFRNCLQIGLVAADRAEGALLFDTGQVRFLISPRRFRCYAITGLDPMVDIRRPVMDVVRGFLGEYRPAVVSVRVGLRTGAEPDDDTVSIAADLDRVWSVGIDAAAAGAEQEPFERIEDELAELIQASRR